MASTPQHNQRFKEKRNNPRRSGARVPSTTFPVAPIEGDIFWKTDTNNLWVWDGASWRQITIT